MIVEEKLNICCHLCGQKDHALLSKVTRKPKGETDFNISEDNYYREIHHCNNCGVYFNARKKELIPDDFYEGQYNRAAAEGNLAKRFNRITNLSFPNSDNKNRVLRLVNSLYERDFFRLGMKVLDVGAGTCVFLHEIKKFGCETYSLDPDQASASHSREIVKVKEAFCGTLSVLPKEYKFDLISFNKVLEHVIDPISLLKQAKDFLAPRGMIYIELPEGEEIVKKKDMLNRAEFFIDHHTVFNVESFLFLVNSAGLNCDNVVKIVDPSGKYSIFGLCTT